MKTYKTSKLKVYDNNGYKYIYVYYKEDNHTLKINTKFEYAKNKMTSENFYNSKMKDHEKLNGHIQEIQWVVDTYINLVSGHRPINQRECMIYVKKNKYHASQVPVETISKITGLSEYYDQFFEAKKENPFIKPISLKNYQSFKNLLTDFQKYNKQTYYLLNVDETLINKLINFTQIDLRNVKGYISKGFLQQNTLKKRLDVFKEFLIWLGDKDIAHFNTHKLFPKIDKTSKEVVYVTNDEIKQLIATRHKIEGDYNKLAFDSFIFNCECGLRYEDLSNLSKSDFKTIPNGYLLTKELNKHSATFSSVSQIPIINSLITEIIEKYDFHFKLLRNQEYNRTLHKLFKKHNLFTEPITAKRKYIKGKVEEDDLFKYDVITCHSCRRSMITNALMNDYNPAQVMQMSGHKNLRTLQKYLNFANTEILKKNIEKKLSENKK
jgi:integrase